jgi:phosphopentomutase
MLVVLDGLGVGDCRYEQGQCPADTLGGVIAAHTPRIPNLTAMGLGDFGGGRYRGPRTGSSARLIPLSPGKDTLTGHWELAGLATGIELRTFPQGFPQDFLSDLQLRLGRGLIGGGPASGTEVIERLGPRHLSTGELIIYTSADSVLQLAAHEDVVPPDELYSLCAVAREAAAGPYLVGRVIARPFRGRPGAFTRFGRRDFSLLPPGRTVLQAAQDAGVEVVSVGKIADVFAGRGISRSVPAANNGAAMQALAELERSWHYPGSHRRRLVFANLNDFDSVYGHRRDTAGFSRALEEFDLFMPRLIPGPESRSLLLLTADHGCDPTAPGTDHTREDVPLLISGAPWRPAHLGAVEGLTAVSGLLSAAFGLEGFSFWPRKAPPEH